MAKFDFNEAIDEEIRALSELKKFMAQPVTARVIERFIASRGEKNGHSRPDPQLVFGTGPTERGALLAATLNACREFTAGVEFTAKEVIVKMEQRGYIFKAKNKDIAVNSALKRLVGKHVLEQTQTAVGQRPAKYKIPQRFPRE